MTALIGLGEVEGEVELFVGWLGGEGAWELLNGQKQLMNKIKSV
jgi:hypothetical protein